MIDACHINKNEKLLDIEIFLKKDYNFSFVLEIDNARNLLKYDRG